MDAVNRTRGDHAVRVEERAAELVRNRRKCGRKPLASLVPAREFIGHRPRRCDDARRRDDEDGRNRHAGLYRGAADRTHDRGDPLRRVRRVVLMDRLEVVRAQHQDDERERRIDLHALLDSGPAVAARFERIVPDRPPTVEAVLDDADSSTGTNQFGLEHARPPLCKRQPPPRAWNDAPAQRIAIDENLLHRVRLLPKIPPSTPRNICRPSWLPTVRAVCLAIVSTMPWRRFVPQRNSST